MIMKFSIIIPAYNEERYLPRLLESIDIARSNYSGGRDTVEVLFNPDAEIITSGRIVISSDSHILDKTDHWINFNRYLLDERLKKFWLIDLSG